MLLQSLKDFFSKNHFDYGRDEIQVRDFHTIYYFLLKANRTIIKEENEPWSFKFLIVMTVASISSYCLSLIAFAHYLQTMNITRSTEVGVYICMINSWLMWLVANKRNLNHYAEVQKMMIKDFEFVCREGKRYKDQFFANQLITWKAGFCAVGLITVIAILMTSVAIVILVWYLVVHEPGDNMKRPLVFSFWLPNYDVSATPIFEVLFVASFSFIVGIGTVYATLLHMVIIWVGHAISKADIVISGLKLLLQDLEEPKTEKEIMQTQAILRERMREIAKQHISLYKLLYHFKSVFATFAMYIQFFTVPAVCFSAFCFADGLNSGNLEIIMLILLIGSIMQALVPCYACTILNIKLISVNEACASVEWWTLGKGSRTIRIDLQLIMARSIIEPSLRSPGMQEMNLATYSSMMMSAYSYFNMLRQI